MSFLPCDILIVPSSIPNDFFIDSSDRYSIIVCCFYRGVPFLRYIFNSAKLLVSMSDFLLFSQENALAWPESANICYFHFKSGDQYLVKHL